MERQYVNLNGQFITPAQGYYNLSTNRYVTDVSQRVGFVVSKKYKIVGTLAQIERFADLNNIPFDKIIATAPRSFFSRLFDCFPRKRDKHFNDLKNTNNLKKINFNAITEFSLLGLKGKCHVIEVIDGDTFIAGVILPIDFLREIQPRRIGISQAVAYSSAGNVTMAIKLRCRFAGIDAVEMKMPGGPEAKLILEELLEKYDNVIYYTCLGPDKYGRHLFRLYFDDEMTKDIAQYLVEHYPKLFSYYYGGKKNPSR